MDRPQTGGIGNITQFYIVFQNLIELNWWKVLHPLLNFWCMYNYISFNAPLHLIRHFLLHINIIPKKLDK